MKSFEEKIEIIKESILKYVQAKYIYLFGSYAYGTPTAESDIDIYVVTPNNVNNFLQLYGKIKSDLTNHKIFFIDLLLSRESDFNERKERRFEKTIRQKGRILYEH